MKYDMLLEALIDIKHELRALARKLGELVKKEDAVGVELDALKAQVAQTASVEASAVVLLQGIAQKIADLAAAGGSPQDFLSLSDSLKGQTDALAAAVAAVP